VSTIDQKDRNFSQASVSYAKVFGLQKIVFHSCTSKDRLKISLDEGETWWLHYFFSESKKWSSNCPWNSFVFSHIAWHGWWRSWSLLQAINLENIHVHLAEPSLISSPKLASSSVPTLILNFFVTRWSNGICSNVHTLLNFLPIFKASHVSSATQFLV